MKDPRQADASEIRSFEGGAESAGCSHAGPIAAGDPVFESRTQCR
jgi:hypothetical protein